MCNKNYDQIMYGSWDIVRNRRTDGRTDGQKKWHIEVDAPPMKVISMNYGSSTSRWKPWKWIRLDLIFMLRDIYINSNLDPLTNSQAAAEAPSLKTSSMEHLSNDQTPSNQHKNSHKLSYMGHLVLMESQWSLIQPHDQNFTMEGMSLSNKY